MTTPTFDRDFDGDGNELQERVVLIRRVAKVVKGGRNLHFNAMVVVGDGRGRVGMGLGRGLAVPDAVRNGNAIARRNMVSIPLNGSTIHHTVNMKFGASRVLMKPAQPGAGVIAGGAVRAVMEALGVRDVVAKALGSRNPINVVKATIAGLEQLRGVHTPLPDEVIQAERAAQKRRDAARPDTSRSRPGDRRRSEAQAAPARAVPTEATPPASGTRGAKAVVPEATAEPAATAEVTAAEGVTAEDAAAKTEAEPEGAVEEADGGADESAAADDAAEEEDDDETGD